MKLHGKNPQSGFAIGLILLTVVLLGAITAAISLSSREGSQNNLKNQNNIAAQAVLNQANTIMAALQQYMEDHNGAIPSKNASGGNIPEGHQKVDALVTAGYLKEVPNPADAMGDAFRNLANNCTDSPQELWCSRWGIYDERFIYVHNVPSKEDSPDSVCAQINAIVFKLTGNDVRPGSSTPSTGSGHDHLGNGFDLISSRTGKESQGCTVISGQTNHGAYFRRF